MCDGRSNFDAVLALWAMLGFPQTSVLPLYNGNRCGSRSCDGETVFANAHKLPLMFEQFPCLKATSWARAVTDWLEGAKIADPFSEECELLWAFRETALPLLQQLLETQRQKGEWQEQLECCWIFVRNPLYAPGNDPWARPLPSGRTESSVFEFMTGWTTWPTSILFTGLSVVVPSGIHPYSAKNCSEQDCIFARHALDSPSDDPWTFVYKSDFAKPSALNRVTQWTLWSARTLVAGLSKVTTTLFKVFCNDTRPDGGTESRHYSVTLYDPDLIYSGIYAYDFVPIRIPAKIVSNYLRSHGNCLGPFAIRAKSCWLPCLLPEFMQFIGSHTVELRIARRSCIPLSDLLAKLTAVKHLTLPIDQFPEQAVWSRKLAPWIADARNELRCLTLVLQGTELERRFWPNIATLLAACRSSAYLQNLSLRISLPSKQKAPLLLRNLAESFLEMQCVKPCRGTSTVRPYILHDRIMLSVVVMEDFQCTAIRLFQ